MKCYTCYSPSHALLYERYFLPTVPNELHLHVTHLPDFCKTGGWEEAGWLEAVTAKAAAMHHAAVDTPDGEIALFSDVDVQFFGPVADDLQRCLGGWDVAFQDDGPAGHCTGFYVFRSSYLVRELFRQVMRDMSTGAHRHDQDRTNALLAPIGLRYTKLPARYWSYGQQRRGLWAPGKPLGLPENLLVHHANWVMGINNKVKLLEAVRRGETKA